MRFCKCAKLYDETQKKVALSFGSGQEALTYRHHVLNVLKGMEGWNYKLGKPPVGHLARSLATFLLELVS